MTSNFSDLKYTDSLGWKNKLSRALWGVVWICLFRPTPRLGFNAWRICLLKLFGAKIGEGTRVAPSCKIWAPWNLEIGQYTAIAEGVDLYTMDKMTIGSKVAISQRSFICCGSHDISSLKRPLITKPIIIMDHVWIASEVFVHPGISIGEGAVISARSVVHKNLDPWKVYAGNPCQPVKDREISKNS